MMNRKKIGLIALPLLAAAAITTIAWLWIYYYPTEVSAPVMEADVPYRTVTFKAEEGVKFHHTTGSNITIPANALVDKHGNLVTGEVNVKYREFHDAYQIMQAGIPMGNIENDALQSAGMFEIKAFQGNDELDLGAGKEIGVQLAAYRPSDGYDIYQLNKDNKWDLTGKAVRSVNTEKFDKCAALPPLPSHPQDPRASADDIIVDVDADYKTNPHLNAVRATKWKAVRQPGESMEDKLWAFRIAWDNLKIEKDDPEHQIYRMVMSASIPDSTYKNKIRKSFSLKVMPVLTGDDLVAALEDFNKQMAEYDKGAEMILAEERRLAEEADAVNSFSINDMGLWNCDKYVNKQEYAKVKAKFDFTDKLNPYYERIKVYVMNHDDNTVQVYNPTTWNSFYLKTGSNTSLMAVMPGGKIAIFSADEFRKVNFRAYENRNEAYQFHMALYDKDEVFARRSVAVR